MYLSSVHLQFGDREHAEKGAARAGDTGMHFWEERSQQQRARFRPLRALRAGGNITSLASKERRGAWA